MFVRNVETNLIKDDTPVDLKEKIEDHNIVDNSSVDIKLGNGDSIISLKDVENYSLVTDGNISISFDDDDTYLVDK